VGEGEEGRRPSQASQYFCLPYRQIPTEVEREVYVRHSVFVCVCVCVRAHVCVYMLVLLPPAGSPPEWGPHSHFWLW